MLYKEYKPSSCLDKYIFRYWTLKTDAVSEIEKCIPDGYIKMFIYLNDTSPAYTDDKGYRKPWKDGIGGHPIDKRILVQAIEGLHMVCCLIKPTFFYQITGIPLHTLNNSITELDLLFGKEILELKEKMQESQADEQKIYLLNQFFLTKLKNNMVSRQQGPQIEYAQNLMLSQRGLPEINKICRLVNISERSMERHFLIHIGVSPKYYSRILRFNHVYRLKKASNNIDWNDIAFNCGYYDQNHFIKEFKHFTNIVPTLFYSENHQIKDMYLGK